MHILSTMGGVQYHRGLSWVLWGVILSTMGGDHDAHGGFMSTMEGKSFVIWVPHSTEHPHGTQISKDGIPHGTEHPPQYSWYPPHASWYPPTVIKISPWYSRYPHGTQDIPHGTHDIPHGTHDIPMVLTISPMVLTISPYSTQDIPMVLMISPHGTEHPMVLHTPTVLHTHYTGWFAKLEKLENSNLAWW